MKRVSVIAVLTLLVILGPFLPLRTFPVQGDAPLDFDIPNGHFYKQANGQGGAGDTGYAVVDDAAAAFWTAMQNLGGVDQVGYPVSQRFIWDNFVTQAFQKVVFQWRSDTNSVNFVNIFDELSAAGMDEWLLVVRQVPPSADWSSDQGLSFDQIVQNHYALLAGNEEISEVYFSSPDPILYNGLPMGAEDFGDVYVVRAQRKAFQNWEVNTPWAAAGSVTVANGGDLGKEAGLYPPSAIVPTTWPPSSPTPVPTAVPTPSCPGAPVISSFTVSPSTIDPGGQATLSWGLVSNANSVTIDQGIGGVATPGSRTVSPAGTTIYTLTATGCGGTRTASVTLTVRTPAVVVPAVTQVSPPNGAVLRATPRVATLTWLPVNIPGGVTYNVEVQINQHGLWNPLVTTGSLVGTSFTTPEFPLDGLGRWRVWATSPTAGDGPQSDFWTFNFAPEAASYAGTWLNSDDSAPLQKLVITASGNTLNVTAFTSCVPQPCQWPTASGPYTGEPFNINIVADGTVIHQLSLSIVDTAATVMQVVDTSATIGGTATYIFHKQ